MMSDEEGDFRNRSGELFKIECLILGLIGDSGEVIGCAQSGIFISTCLGLEPLESDEAKDCFLPENENSEVVGEYSE